jgi:omega-hydroxy-beta-dihydromenaquinone-9 sulfotransferase
MSWRKRFLLSFGPSILGGITFGDWLRLLSENRFDIHPSYWLRASIITACSLGNSLDRRREEAHYGRAIRDAIAAPPVFVLGLARSGTTHLQNLLAVDERFAFPNWYQAAYPHSFLGTEARRSKLLGFLVPETRFQDNMAYGLRFPAEDEFALCTISARSPLMSSIFPRRAEHYARYGTLDDVPEAEVAEWRAALLGFVKKLACKNGKPLVLKSPFHTGRIRRLLDIFPEAKFVHIHRDPYAVFPSACHTVREAMRYCTLQRHALDVEEWTIRRYRELVDAFLAEKDAIPRGRFHELRYEDLERDPIGQMRSTYEALGLPDFGEVEPSVRRYAASLGGYQKNEYAEIDPATKERLRNEWQRAFSAWGYPV